MKYICAGCDAEIEDPKRPCENCGVTCAVAEGIDDPNCPVPDPGLEHGRDCTCPIHAGRTA